MSSILIGSTKSFKAWPPFRSRRKRIDDLDARLLEIRVVPSGYDEVVNEGRSCNQTIFDRHRKA